MLKAQAIRFSLPTQQQARRVGTTVFGPTTRRDAALRPAWVPMRPVAKPSAVFQWVVRLTDDGRAGQSRAQEGTA